MKAEEEQQQASPPYVTMDTPKHRMRIGDECQINPAYLSNDYDDETMDEEWMKRTKL